MGGGGFLEVEKPALELEEPASPTSALADRVAGAREVVAA